MSNNKHELKTKARNLYVHHYKTLSEIAEACGKTDVTIRLWRKAAADLGDDWDKARSASRISEGGLGNLTAQILEEFALKSQSVMEQLKSVEDPLEAAEAMAKVSTAYVKLSNALKNSTPQLNELAVAQKVIKELKTFIQDKYPQHIGVFVDILEPFSVVLSKTLGRSNER